MDESNEQILQMNNSKTNEPILLTNYLKQQQRAISLNQFNELYHN